MAPTMAPAAIEPPPGIVTDFSEPNQLWKWNVLCQAMCLGLPGIMWFLRLYVRFWIKRVCILEDYLTVLCYICLAVYCALLTTLIQQHGGVHEWNLNTAEAMSTLYWVNVVQIWYGTSAAFIKSTILCLYLRIFSPQRWTVFDTSIRVFIATICAFYIALSLAKVFQCVPRERIWDPSVDGTCVNLSALLDSSGIFNILSDITILLVPVKGLWKLKVSRKRKFGIYAIFTVGIIGPAFSIIGLVMRFKLADSADQSFNQPVILLWANAELATGMMIICLPALPGLLQKRKRLPSQHTQSHTAQTNRFAFHRSPFPLTDFSEKEPPYLPYMKNAYFELPEDNHHFNQALGQTASVVNNIKGGFEVSVHPLDEVPETGRIVKTVTLEQTR